MKRFKAKKIKKNKKKRLLIIFMFFFFFSYAFIFKYLDSHRLKKSILNKDVYYINPKINNVIVNFVDQKVSNPSSFLDNKVKNAKAVKSVTSKIKHVSNNVNTTKKNDGVLVYLYNTHQTEGYNGYNIYDATSYLSNILQKDGVNNYFERQSIKTFLDSNNMKYYESYKVSRKYLLKVKESNSSIRYFFDIHRDSISKDKVTLNYNNNDYAKILFLVGTDNKNYEENEKSASILSNILNKKVPSISKGILKKGGKGVNGIYNQDISKESFLIEIGSVYSTKQEVTNTLNVLKEAIKEYIEVNYDQL